MSRIAIIGGHGKIALQLAGLLTADGHTVSSLIRNPAQRDDVEATGATAVVADVENLDTDAIAAVLREHDGVVWSAGAGGGAPERTYAVDRDAAIRSMDAATAAGARRYVMVSYLGSRSDHGVSPDNSFFAYAESKSAADAYLRESPLDWTILAPGSLTLDAGEGLIEISPTPAQTSIARNDVARVAAAVLERPETVGTTIPFNTGTTSIADALDTMAAGV